MRWADTSLPDIRVLEPEVFEDDRGWFFEVWRDSFSREIGEDLCFLQENHSCSRKNVLRGLHYQVNNAQGKLVRVVKGEIFDVAVDLRKSSSAFGRWCSVLLSDQNRRQLWIPPGFAHGFLVTSDDAEVIYKCTAYYDRQAERTVRWDDPDLAIAWPMQIGVSPILSAKDGEGTLLRFADVFP